MHFFKNKTLSIHDPSTCLHFYLGHLSVQGLVCLLPSFNNQITAWLSTALLIDISVWVCFVLTATKKLNIKSQDLYLFERINVICWRVKFWKSFPNRPQKGGLLVLWAHKERWWNKTGQVGPAHTGADCSLLGLKPEFGKTCPTTPGAQNRLLWWPVWAMWQT